MGAQTQQNKVDLPARRSPEWFAALQFPKPFGMGSATLWQKTVFSWGDPLLVKGEYAQITEDMADSLPPPEDEAPVKAQQFAACYSSCRVRLLRDLFRCVCAAWRCLVFTGVTYITRCCCSKLLPQASCVFCEATYSSEL